MGFILLACLSGAKYFYISDFETAIFFIKGLFLASIVNFLIHWYGAHYHRYFGFYNLLNVHCIILSTI